MKRIIALVLSIVMMFSLVACGAKEEAPTEENNGENSTEVEEIGEETPSMEGSTLKVVAAYGGKEQIFDVFSEKTGIKVEFIDMSSGEVLARTEAEGGNPMADVWFGGGADSFIAAADKGLLEQYKSPEAITIPEKYKGKDGYWTGISLVLAGFFVNEEVLQEKDIKIPKTWDDLAKPEYKNEFLMADPAISGTTYAVVNGILQVKGEEGWEYFKKISENVLFFAKRGGEPPKKVATGEVAVGLTPMSGEFIAMEDKYPVKAIYPEDGIPWVPASMAIFKNCDNLEAAKAFVDWALSIEGQEIIRDADPRVMVRPEVEVPDMMKNVPLDKLLEVDFGLFGSQRDDIIEKWQAEITK